MQRQSVSWPIHGEGGFEMTQNRPNSNSKTSKSFGFEIFIEPFRHSKGIHISKRFALWFDETEIRLNLQECKLMLERRHDVLALLTGLANIVCELVLCDISVKAVL